MSDQVGGPAKYLPLTVGYEENLRDHQLEFALSEGASLSKALPWFFGRSPDEYRL
jgi:hypothetical protein